MLKFAAVVTLAFSQPACADVIEMIHAPSLKPIKLSKNRIDKMAMSARMTTLNIFNFSGNFRPNYLIDAFRSASDKNMFSINRIVSVRIIGDRAFVLAVAGRHLTPRVFGETYTYIQCKFDAAGDVVAIDLDI